MSNDTFYPDDQGGQVDWNANIITELPGLYTELGLTTAERDAIIADCKYQIFLLTTVGEMANSAFGSLHGFVKTMERSPLNSPDITAPTLPVWPADAPTIVPPGLAARRSAWVATGKKANGYNKATNGRILRLEPVRTPIDWATYIAQLRSLKAIGHEQVLVTVGKAGGQVTMLKLMMRLKGTADFKQVAMFTSRTYIDSTPLAQAGVPEEREYQLIAMKNDVVVGQPSPILSAVVS